MKREFLQELKVNDQPLPKEIIDAIMAENGRDIEAAKGSQDMQILRQEAAAWQEKFTKAEEEHARQLDRLTFEGQLRQAVAAAKGRNSKAILALLDVEALQTSQDREAAIRQAVEDLKTQEGYLFEAAVPPPYAGMTGTSFINNQEVPTDLAGALREKFERK